MKMRKAFGYGNIVLGSLFLIYQVHFLNIEGSLFELLRDIFMGIAGFSLCMAQAIDSIWEKYEMTYVKKFLYFAFLIAGILSIVAVFLVTNFHKVDKMPPSPLP